MWLEAHAMCGTRNTHIRENRKHVYLDVRDLKHFKRKTEDQYRDIDGDGARDGTHGSWSQIIIRRVIAIKSSSVEGNKLKIYFAHYVHFSVYHILRYLFPIHHVCPQSNTHDISVLCYIIRTYRGRNKTISIAISRQIITTTILVWWKSKHWLLRYLVHSSGESPIDSSFM